MNKIPNLVLSLIVKNEGHIIKETLSNIYKYIDYYVINDTGSTDNTCEVIKNFFDEKNIKGEIISHEFRTCECHSGIYKKYSFFHFGWNRSYAIKMCKGKGKYIWIIDADDLVVGDFKIPELKDDCYLLKYGKDFTYQRAQIFKNDETYNWRYEGALHEYLACDKPNYSKSFIEGDYFIDSRRLGARSSDPLKYLKDAKIFEELLIEEPKNERYAFYCAQSYFDYGDLKNAIKWYKKRIEMGGWFEEVLYSYFRVAQAMEALNYPWKETEEAYLNTFKYCKIRSEPLYRIARHYRLTNDFANAYKYAKIAEKIPFPDKHILFVYKDIYDYKVFDELAIASYYLGKYHESYSLNKKILENKEIVIPKEDIERIKNNLKFSEQKLNEQNKKLCCFYTGNSLINKDSMLIRIVNSYSKYYKILLIGNKIENNLFNDCIIASTDEILKSIDKKLLVDYLILYDSINFLLDNIPVESENIILFQLDQFIKIILNNNMIIHFYNQDYLNKMFTKIIKIICVDEKVKNKISNDYKLPNDILFNIDKESDNEYYKIIEESKSQYKFKNLMENNPNGLIFKEPTYIKFLKENKHNYDFSKKLILTYFMDVVKQLPNMPEPLLNLSKIYLDFNDLTNSLLTLDEALEVSKNNNVYKDIINIEKALILNKTGKHIESFDLADKVLKRDFLPEIMRIDAENIRDVNIDPLKDSYLIYPHNKIIKLQKHIKNKQPIKKQKIMFSVTTCKRYDLFEKTINSFLNCCTDYDLIDYWLCVDDNSSNEDINLMKKNYSFFNFILKNNSQKGHFVSMNMIRDFAINNGMDYILHMEDDWHFIEKRNYVSDSLKILTEDNIIGQVLFNKNYAEIEPVKRRIKGGLIKRTKSNLRYILHEHYDTGTKEYSDFIERNKGFGTTAYWPHFSFRPSLLKVSMLIDVGVYYNTGHFEMQYAIEYKARGYKSAFLDTFSSIHIGKKTWEHNGKNSYSLNQTGQFSINDESLSIRILSDNKYLDIWKDFKANSKNKLPYFIRQLPRHITHLSDFEKKIFNNNDFCYDRTILDKIMSHLDIFLQNKSKYIMILNDSIILNENFDTYFKLLTEKINNNNYDLIILDNSNNNETSDLFNILPYQNSFNLFQLNGYIISSPCVKKILEYFSINGIKNVSEGLSFDSHNLGVNTYILNKQLFEFNSVNAQLMVPEKQFQIQNYKFYSNLDSFGNDIGYYPGKSIDELKVICDASNGIAFNTLGWIKNKINTENEFIYLPESTKFSEGLFVKIK